MKAVIMAGGKGTRLQGINKDIPKPMFPVCGKPILEYQIESLKRSGINDITLIIGHLGHIIKEHFGDGMNYGVEIKYLEETEPLGSAGSLYYLKGLSEEDFFLVFGDLILDVDFVRFYEYHKKKGGQITLFTHPNSHPYDSDILLADENNLVLGIISKKEERKGYYHNFVNAGLYCLSSEILANIQSPVKTDFEGELLKDAIRKRTVYAYRSPEYVKDMGTPDRLRVVEQDVKKGIVTFKCLRNKQKAVFLDRDGTINVLKGFLTNPNDFELIPESTEAIEKLNHSEFLVIVVTNQPVIARGQCTIECLDEIHRKMETELGEKGAYIDALFYCPHHPDKGFKGEVAELKIECNCRKPKTGLLEAAAEKWHIDLGKSWMIGDTTRDVQTGFNAGTKTILLQTGEAGNDNSFDAIADYTAKNLWEATKIILEN